MLTLPMPAGLLLAAMCVVFAAGIVRGFAGFGFSALCVAGMSLFVSPAEVVPPIFVLEVLASLTLLRSALEGRRLELAQLAGGGQCAVHPAGCGAAGLCGRNARCGC